nr:hypothetical protein [Tanacetum cinerariifolium]GFA82182.1 hypothetical protein [Tanacetum cinerariifolium]
MSKILKPIYIGNLENSHHGMSQELKTTTRMFSSYFNYNHQVNVQFLLQLKPEFLKKAQRENPRLYDIGCYNDNLALMLAPESDEKRMDESIPWDKKCKSSIELLKIKSSVDTIIDGVERCKETIAKRTYFGHIDPFVKNTIEANFSQAIRRINAGLEQFHVYLNDEMVADLRRSTVSNTPLSSNSFAARRDCPIHRQLWVLKAHDGKYQASN